MDTLTIILIGYAVNLALYSLAFVRVGHWIFVDWSWHDTVMVVVPYGTAIFPLLVFLTEPWRR
jgi:hypothetical protein